MTKTIQAQIRLVERRFVITIVLLAVLSVVGLGLILYQANAIRFNESVSSSELSTLVEDSPSVAQYLEEQKDFEAHFITIANLVKDDQQKNLGQSLILISIPVIIIAGLIGYLIAKYLLGPVRESYLSQERFMQDAAHELRNPLAAINVALDGVDGQQANSTFYKTIRRQSKRLVNIVEDLLFLERRKSGEKIESINISDLLNDVLEDLQPAISAKKLRLKNSIQPDIELKMDPQDFIKLSKNIIENAIKYSNPSKKIDVTLSSNSQFELIVEDRGIGIPQNEIENIGNRFYRAKNVARTPGTGLGIAIVQKVLNAYGGKLEIDSVEGKGTTVTAKI